jgi:hypothetical protein
MSDLERSNLAQIEMLNQRGGRTLSIVDLIRAGTISVEAAAYVGHRVSQGASLLTAANPGGAGKTALLAALLGFLPEGLPIITVEGPRHVAAAEQATAPACYLAHEIGAGHWYGYLWGASVARYLALARGPHTVASCLHADTLEEMRAALAAPPLEVAPETLLGIDFLLFMHVDREARGYRRRVDAISESQAGEHRSIFRWNRERDAYEALVAMDGEAAAVARVLAEMAEAGVVEYGKVRARLSS